MIRHVLTLAFGQGGNAHTHTGVGWSAPEPEFRWMIGEGSDLWLEHPGADADYLLECTFDPFIHPPKLPAQRVIVAVRGVPIGESVLSHSGLRGFRIPAHVLAAPGPVRITFLHPDAARPNSFKETSDDRPLAVAICTARLIQLPQSATATELGWAAPRPWSSWASGLCIGPAASPPSTAANLAPAELVTRFESLGDNCEFGLVQRRSGAEPLGLLRFSSIELHELIRGIRSGFAGLGDLDNLALWDDADGKEYVVRETSYGMTYHTFLYKDQVTEEGLLKRQSARLKFLGRKLMDDIRTAEKIFVVKRNEPLREDEILPVYVALNEAAPNTLLYVVPADGENPAGSVKQIIPGLLRGHIDRFAPPENAHQLSLAVWLQICGKACEVAAPPRQAAVPQPA